VASTADPPAPDAVTFGFLTERIRAAVQEVAGHDANPTDPFRGLYISDDLALSLAGTAPGSTFDERLSEAAARLRLDPLDAAVLGLCAAPELSPRYGRLFAYLQDDVTRKLATPRLVSELLQGPGVTPADVLRCFAVDAPLRRDGALRLLDGEAVVPLAERAVKLGPRLASFLLGARLDSDGSSARLRVVPALARDPGRAQTVRRLAALLACDPPLPVIVAGPDAAALVAAAVAQPLLLADVRDLGDRDLMAEANLVCALEALRLCFDGLELIEPVDRARLLRALEQRPGGVVMITPSRAAALALGDRTTIVLEAPMPSLQERVGAWAQISGADDVLDVAAKFRLSIGQIHEAAEVAVLAAAARGAATPTARDLDEGARQASSSRLGELAARLDPVHRWHDLVLPDRQLSLLKSISSYLRHRDLVLQQWGYERTVARTQGLKAMFAGESGTGKTMAAQRAGPRAVPRRPRDRRVEVHRRDREEPRPHLRRRRGLQRDPLLRRGRRAVRQALRRLRRPRPLREHRGRLPAPEDGGLRGRGHPRDELPLEHRRRVPAPPGLRHRLPVPGGRRPAAHLGAAAARPGTGG